MCVQQLLCVSVSVCKSVCRFFCDNTIVSKTCLYVEACLYVKMLFLFFCLVFLRFIFLSRQFLHMNLFFTTCLHHVSSFQASWYISILMFHGKRSSYLVKPFTMLLDTLGPSVVQFFSRNFNSLSGISQLALFDHRWSKFVEISVSYQHHISVMVDSTLQYLWL